MTRISVVAVNLRFYQWIGIHPADGARIIPDRTVLLRADQILGAFRTVFDQLTRPKKQAILLGVDISLAALSVAFSVFLADPSLNESLGAWVFFFAALASFFVLIGSLFLGIHKIKLKAYEGMSALKTGLVGALTAAGLYLVSAILGQRLPFSAIVFFALVYPTLNIVIRFGLLHLLLALLHFGKARQNVVIYGCGMTGTQLAYAFRRHETVKVVAFLDDNPSLHGMNVLGLTVNAPDKISSLVQRHKVERVLLAMPSLTASRRNSIARSLMELGLEVQSLPSFAQLAGAEALTRSLEPMTAGKLLDRPLVPDLSPTAQDAYRGKCVMVTGAGGSVGSELCRQLLAYQPSRIILFEISELALYTVHRELSTRTDIDGIELVPVLGSVAEYRQVHAVCEQNNVDVILHAAAYKHVPLVEANPLAGIVNNVLGTRTLTETAAQLEISRFIMISTDKAVRPTNVMGATKRVAELVVQDIANRAEGTDFSIVRFGNVLGSSGSVVPLFRDQISRGGPVTLTHDDVTRYFMTISEAAQLVLIAGSMPKDRADGAGDVYVLDMGQPIKIRDLAVRMIHAAGYTVKDESNPQGDIEIVVTGLRPGEKLHEELLIEPGMLTTPHEKILRARERSLGSVEIASTLRELRNAVATGDSEGALAVLDGVVEDYSVNRRKPMGSMRA